MTGISEELKQAWIKAWVAYGFGDYDVAGKRFHFWLQCFQKERNQFVSGWSSRNKVNSEQLLAEIARHMRPVQGRKTLFAEQQRLNSAFWAGRHLMVMLSRQERTIEGPLHTVTDNSQPEPLRQTPVSAPTASAAKRASGAVIPPPSQRPSVVEVVAAAPRPAPMPTVAVTEVTVEMAPKPATVVEAVDEELPLEDLDLSDLDAEGLELEDIDLEDLDEASLEDMQLDDLELEGLEDLDLDTDLEGLDLGE